MSNNTLMILGTERSGTTFLGKLFDSHPEVIYRHEPDSEEINRGIPFMPNISEIGTYRTEAAEYLEKLKHTTTLKTAGRRPFFPKHYRSRVGESVFRASIIAKVARENIGLPESRDLTISDRIRRDHAPGFCVLKSVNSLCRFALFATAAPTYRFLHLIRHPCGVIASRFRGFEKNTMSSRTYLKSLFQLPEAKLYPFSFSDMAARTFEEQAAYDWMVKNDKVARDMQGNNCYRPVIYGALCNDLESVLHGLFRHVKLQWHPQTERFIHRLKHISLKKRPSYFDILRNPAIGQHSWKNELTSSQINRILAVVAHTQMDAVQDVLK